MLLFFSIVEIALGQRNFLQNSSQDFLTSGMLSSRESSTSKFNETTSNSDALDIFANKKKLLKMIRLFLIHDKKETDSNLVTHMKKLQKRSLADLVVEFENDPGFEKRYLFLEYLKTFLMRYQNLSEDNANREINLLNNLSIDQMYRNYYGWCQKLTKAQMLEIIHEQIQFDQGFSGYDADTDVATLSQLSLPNIRDRFMQYQKTFVTKDFASDQLKIHRYERLQQKYDEQRLQRSNLRRFPLIKNIEELLPSTITNWTDRQLFEKISQKMNDLGFSVQDIQQEIDRLKQSSIADLQKDYPQLQHQLSQQLYYFDTVQYQDSGNVKTADFWLKQLHAWGTTAATIGSYAASAGGYDPGLFNAVAGFALFDPRLTLATGQTKRDLLDMVYAQYAAFDALHDVYINHEFNGSRLWTKQELLQNIVDCLTDLGFNSKISRKQEAAYRDLTKQELQDLYDELNYFTHHKDEMNLSLFEKKVLVQTKIELLQQINDDLERLHLPQDEIDATVDQLRKENITFVRAARIDAHKAVVSRPIKLGVMPKFVTPREQKIRNAPKALAHIILEKAPTVVQSEWRDKSPSYIQWKKMALKDHVSRQQDGIFERNADLAFRIQRAHSLIGVGRHVQRKNFLAEHVAY